MHSTSGNGISTLRLEKKATGICFSAFINKIMFEVTMKMKIATTTDEMKIGEGLFNGFYFKIARAKIFAKRKVRKRDLL